MNKGQHIRRISLIIGMIFVMSGCAGWGRGCSSWYAESFGSDWIIVQYQFNGTPINCWKLHDTSVTNETNSDGIYWKDRRTNHLVHIAGWYNRIQVDGRDFVTAAQLAGVDVDKCTNGKYSPSERQ